MATSKEASATAVAAEWFERRTYDHRQFGDLPALDRRKRELGLTVSVVLPAREVADTIGAIIDHIHASNERARLVDQILVIDADSPDGSASIAERHGAEVFLESELMPGLGPTIGKGDAMWRALSVARGDVVVYLDSDTLDFAPHFVAGTLGPLLTATGVQFVKATYSRPPEPSSRLELDNGGRVTELMAKPLFSLFYPELSGFAQPLAGEMAAPRELLGSIPFLTGYAVETGMMIDLLRTVGLDAMAQVDLGARTNRNQRLLDLGKMAYAVLRAVELRMRAEGRLLDEDATGPASNGALYLHAIHTRGAFELERSSVDLVERPPMAKLLAVDR
jgi:glucosyl-3-phosphoglycerate synthase